jgi:hypothetical protein
MRVRAVIQVLNKPNAFRVSQFRSTCLKINWESQVLYGRASDVNF